MRTNLLLTSALATLGAAAVVDTKGAPVEVNLPGPNKKVVRVLPASTIPPTEAAMRRRDMSRQEFKSDYLRLTPWDRVPSMMPNNYERNQRREAAASGNADEIARRADL